SMISGVLNLRGDLALAGTSLAITFPDFVISTDSPCSIHAATRGKRLRKSLTVAVFIVRQLMSHAMEKSTATASASPSGAWSLTDGPEKNYLSFLMRTLE